MKRLSFVILVLCIVLGFCGYACAIVKDDGSTGTPSTSSDANYYASLAFELNMGGHYDQAIDNANTALSYDPDFAYAWYQLGVALNELGKYDKAFEAFDNAVEHEPYWALPYYSIGLTFENRGMYAEAALAYQEAVNRHYPGAKEAYDRVIQYI